MFGLFRKSAEGVKVDDKIWMSAAEKIEAVGEMLQRNPGCLFLAWFARTQADYAEALGLPPDTASVRLVSQVGPNDTAGKMVIFLEHYPLPAVEQEHFKRLNLATVPVLSALDEPLFALFGGERIADIMKQLGTVQGEIVEHRMISASIRRAQAKIADKVKFEKKADSAEQWFKSNLGP